jgi:hypothetical protein
LTSLVGTQGYYPFGETRYRTGKVYINKLYTPIRGQASQQQIAGLGLYNYRVRYYGPYLPWRFMVR